MKNILSVAILILLIGGLVYVGINNREENNIEPTQVSFSQSLRLPITDTKNLETEESPNIVSKNDIIQDNDSNNYNNYNDYNNSSYISFFLPPAPVNVNLTAGVVSQKIYLSETGDVEEQNFISWRDAVEFQGYDFSDSKTMEKLKSVRLEFNTLKEVRDKNKTSLNRHIENIKLFINQNSPTTVDFPDDMLLGDLWEKLFEIDVNVGGVSPELQQRYIQSFYNIPITLEKELEIAEFTQGESISGSINEEKEQEIQAYLQSEEYIQLEQDLNQEINTEPSVENLFNSQIVATLLDIFLAPIGSPLEEHPPKHPPASRDRPPLAPQCGGNTRVPEFPPGYNTFATCCSGCPLCPPCIGVFCDCICGCNPPVAYIWDANTGICGCGE